ncbi:MAG TPA: hypothetical protein VGI06_05970, partial [Acidimicrobiales bacterium]
TDASANDHVKAFYTGVDALLLYPLGHGIGTGPGIGQRFNTYGQLTPENYYLQIGDELGFAGITLFVLFTILALHRLGAAQRDGPGATLVSAARTAGVGLALGCFLLHVWADYSTALSFWALAGAALGFGEVARDGSPVMRRPHRSGTGHRPTDRPAPAPLIGVPEWQPVPRLPAG